MFAEVSLPISSFQTFTYSIPKELKKVLFVGSRVKVPFGRRKINGIVVSFIKESSFNGELKSIIDIDDATPVLSNELWKLINWISHYYITPIALAYNTVLPFALLNNHSPRQTWFVKYVDGNDIHKNNNLKKLSPKQHYIFNVIKKASPKYLKVSILKRMSSNPISICKALEAKGFVNLKKSSQNPITSTNSFKPIKKNILYNEEQLKVIKSLNNSIISKKYSPNLLHGVTGSGKTEVFIEIIKTVKKIGKCSIVLIPEISLTSQIAGRFREVFGDDMALWHSQLSKSQRAKTWQDINDGTCKIVIGARSSIFSPIKNLGLIIVDEEQDSSYKQDSPSPRYHARDVAIMRAKIEKCTVVLSSATPSLETFYNYKLKKYNYLKLSKRYGNAIYPKVHVVDLIDESKETGKFNIIISGLLQGKIEKRLNDDEQVLLIQNRRGFSPTVKCSDCGHIFMCLSCKTPLTFHKYDNNFKCHICGFISNKKLDSCKECLSQNFSYMGTGTQKVEELIQKTFPNARVARLDHDISKRNSPTIKVLQDFQDGEIDILLGTQMIAKGLDFPEITLVGIINADLGLHIPDFRSSEKTFQLIYQAAGRSGRGKKRGEVVIQTYEKENLVINSASKLNLKKYYDSMLTDRYTLNYPPFSWISKIEFLGLNAKSVSSLSNRIRNNFFGMYKGLEILGPAPCFKEKINNKYRFQIILKSSKKYDSNSEKLHSFISKNFIEQKNRLIGSNKIHIHIDPISMI
tara:strand:- start:3738 stop:5975 length:2238 start_codon:yes stop_codon:yes gene_type:complete